MDSEEESLNKENEGLATISEEDEHEGQSGFADTFQEVNFYRNQIPNIDTRNVNTRVLRDSITSLPETEKNASSINPETSTSFDRTLRFNDSQLQNGDFSQKY
ncbi:hypothetical protein HHI36_015624 [Cryptolaemus montrouzieri]|uniref:Uncharacterized protein n=1 Tax=Cryptolaemus montrouzieri TaxID=559131 RepID=A0ABD2N6Z3_9CUCU